MSDEELFCICRLPWDGVSPMLACDKCDQWFHFNCMELAELKGEAPAYWLCDDCEETATAEELDKAEKAREAKIGANKRANAGGGAAKATKKVKTEAASTADSAPAQPQINLAPVTFEEKTEISRAIDQLPTNELTEVVKMIKARAPEAITVVGEDELTIDFDRLDVYLLRELQDKYT